MNTIFWPQFSVNQSSDGLVVLNRLISYKDSLPQKTVVGSEQILLPNVLNTGSLATVGKITLYAQVRNKLL